MRHMNDRLREAQARIQDEVVGPCERLTVEVNRLRRQMESMKLEHAEVLAREAKAYQDLIDAKYVADVYRLRAEIYEKTLRDAGYAFEGEYPKPPLDKFSGDESGPHKGPWIVCEHADIIGCRETDNVATIASNHADPWFSSVYGDSSGWDGMVECVRIALGELLMRLRALIKNDTGEGRRSFIEWVESHMGQGLSGDDGWRLGQ